MSVPAGVTRVVTRVVTRIAASALASKAFRAFGARVVFAALHRLAAQTENKLDDEAVRLVEQAFYGDDHKQKTAIKSLYDQGRAE